MQKVINIGKYTYILVIALYIFCDLKVDQLWIEYGCGKNHRCLPIHNHVKLIGKEKCTVLLFWYTLTGCNTVSSEKRLQGMRVAVSLDLLNDF